LRRCAARTTVFYVRLPRLLPALAIGHGDGIYVL
jgi:hypothetical protein